MLSSEALQRRSQQQQTVPGLHPVLVLGAVESRGQLRQRHGKPDLGFRVSPGTVGRARLLLLRLPGFVTASSEPVLRETEAPSCEPLLCVSQNCGSLS